MLPHHAYLLRVEDAKPETSQAFVSSLQIEEVNYVTLDSFGIGDVRTLTAQAFVRPQVGDTQVIVVTTSTITVEAQQALLKILEEPPVSTIFVFCLPKTLYLLPTLLSRFFDVTSLENLEIPKENKTLDEFCTLRIADRITEITNRLGKKDLVWVDEIKACLLQKLVNDSKVLAPEKLTLLFFVAEHLQTRGASNKLLLEEMALSL